MTDKNDLKERGMLESNLTFINQNQHEFNDISVSKAVKEGYGLSHHVYNACKIIINQVNDVKFIVKNNKGETVHNHPIEQLLKNPHPELTRNQFLDLMTLFLLLSGTAYIHKVKGVQRTQQLWLINPDRIAPYSSTKNEQLIGGYKLKNKTGMFVNTNQFTPENTFRVLFVSPSEPLKGISPLQALSRTIDLDNAQRKFQYTTIKNGGGVSSIISVEDKLTQDQAMTWMSKLKQMITGERAGLPLLLTGKTNLHKVGMSSKELDYLESLKINKEDIYTTFGIPAPLYSSDAQTYSNFSDSLRVLWEQSVLPTVDLIVDTFNKAFEDELGDNYISYDKSQITALQGVDMKKIEAAQKLWEMGVPFSQLNKKYDLGFEEFENWDESYPAFKYNASAEEALEQEKEEIKEDKSKKKRGLISLRADRDKTEEAKLQDSLSDSFIKDNVLEVLEEQEEALNKLMGDSLSARENDIEKLIHSFDEKLAEVMNKDALIVARRFYDTVAINERSDNSVEERLLLERIQNNLNEQADILASCEKINENTAKNIIEQLAESKIARETIKEFKERLGDLNLFNSTRALVIARTEAGTWSSVGQLTAGSDAGAKYKIWVDSGFNVRKTHQNRHNEKVGINEKFSSQGYSASPRFPCDPNSDTSDRVSCRCSLDFE